MKRRRPLNRVRVTTDYPPGWSGSPNRYSFPIVSTYYRVYRSTSTHTCQGSTSVSHSWWCETDSTLANVTTVMTSGVGIRYAVPDPVGLGPLHAMQDVLTHHLAPNDGRTVAGFTALPKAQDTP